MARLKGSHDIASQIRGAFIRATKSLDEKGRSLSMIIEDELSAKPLDTLRAISAFVPKEMLLEASITTEIDEMSDEAVNAEIIRLTRQAGIIAIAASASEETHH